MRITSIKLSILFSILILGISAQAQAFETFAKQAIALDYDTGTILLEKNADEKMPTSSMSKTMTLFMVFEALKEGKLTLDTTFPVSEKAWRMQGSKMFVELNSQIKVEDLIRGVAIQSGNDATIVLAEGMGGTEEIFSESMTKRAHELGMTNSNFVNASGWPDDNHYSTARDLAKLAYETLHRFPEDYHYYSEIDFTYHGIKQGNRNPLLYKNIGGDGIKTGHTEVGGYGMIGSGTQNGRRVIFVLNGMKDDKERAIESAKILDWALKNFDTKKFFKPGDEVTTIRTLLGTSPTVSAVIKETLAVTVPKNATSGFKITAKVKEPMIAPIKKDDEIGTLIITLPNGAPPIERPLYAGADVPEVGFFSAAFIKANLLMMGDTLQTP